MKLEHEVEKLVNEAFDDSLEDSRTRYTFELCFGAYGLQPMSQNEARHPIGEAFSRDGVSFTRERARQLFDHAVDHLRYYIADKNIELPMLQQAAIIAESLAPCVPERFSEALYESGLTDVVDFSLESVVLMARHLLDFEFTAFTKGIKNHRYWLRPEDVDLPNEILKSAFKAASKFGAGRVRDMQVLVNIPVSLKENPSLYATIYDRRLQFLRDVLLTDDSLVWLDNEQDWFLFTSAVRNRVCSKIRQLLAIQRSYEVGELIDAIDRSLNSMSIQPRSIPDEIILAIASKVYDCTIYSKDGRDYIERSEAFNREDVFSGDLMELINFLEHGSEISTSEIREEFVNKRGLMTGPALTQKLGQSPFVTPTKRGYLAITGSEAARNARQRSLDNELKRRAKKKAASTPRAPRNTRSKQKVLSKLN